MTSLVGNANQKDGNFRPEANFSPSLWGNIFSCSTMNNQVNIYTFRSFYNNIVFLDIYLVILVKYYG